MVATKRDWLGNRSMLALYGKEIKVGYREKVGYNDENMKWNWHTFGRKSKGQIVKKIIMPWKIHWGVKFLISWLFLPLPPNNPFRNNLMLIFRKYSYHILM